MPVQGMIVGHVVLVERLGPLSEHDIAVAPVGRADQAGAGAPDVLLPRDCSPVRARLIGAPLDAQSEVRVAACPPLRVVAR